MRQNFDQKLLHEIDEPFPCSSEWFAPFKSVFRKSKGHPTCPEQKCPTEPGEKRGDRSLKFVAARGEKYNGVAAEPRKERNA
ncbi:MAG: hypothetical protein C4332_10735 [Meiothermus sp.]